MRRELLDEMTRNGEGQTVEFKTSFAEQNAAIETMVAFANAQGGRVLFGVKNDGTVVGADVGGNTLENLANAIRDHTYPSLPVFIEEVLDGDGKRVVIAEVPSDVPPIVGVYVYSSDPIPPDKAVAANELQAYRRVGRTTQKEDFMRLRRALPSDPRLRVALLQRQGTSRSSPSSLHGSVWMEEGSATAHDVTFRFDPSIAKCDDAYQDLPYPYDDRRATPSVGFMAFRRFEFQLTDIPSLLPSSLKVVAVCKDDWGLTWESSRRVDLLGQAGHDEGVHLVDGGEFSRRIVSFPPKAR